jgi:ethanolamine utilization protein EutA
MHESDEHDIFFGGGGSGVVNSYGVDELALTTIGIDIGSTTFHFMFTAVHMQKDLVLGRFRVVRREILWRSPVYLTPYKGSRIDSSAISLAIELGHQAARIPPEHVDSGAVILTGEALRSDDARQLADGVGVEAGRFVSVSAGHHIEAMLAAFGSGAVGNAREYDQCVLHVDIGGGTAKLAVIDPTGVRQTAAINGGGRIVTIDRTGRITRIGSGARPLARHVGAELIVGTELSPTTAASLAGAFADALTGIINHETKGTAEPRLRLTPVLDRRWRPDVISFSGGVSEYLYGREQRGFGDVGREIADAIRDRIDDGRIALRLIDPGEGIRATVIGAAESTMQLSRNPIDAAADQILPLHNVGVVHPRLDRFHLAASDVASAIRKATSLYGAASNGAVALSLSWEGRTDDAGLRELALGITRGLGAERVAPVVVLVDQPIGVRLGRILTAEFPDGGQVICLEGLHLSSLDFLDVGKRLEPAGVVPIVVKSLLFDVHRRERVHAD